MFFLVVLGLCFGFMSGIEHMALAGFFVSSFWLVLIPVSVWILYALKVIAYNKVEVQNERNTFLYSLPLAGGWIPCVVVALGEFAPALAYGMFLAAFALKTQQWFIFVVIISALLLSTLAIVLALHRALASPSNEETTSRPVRWLDKRFTKPAAWILTEGILRSQPGMIFTIKLASCAVVYGSTQLYLYDTYDARLYLMSACAIFSANLAVVYRYQRFEVAQLLLMRSLPLSFGRRIGTFSVTMCILCFPEIAILGTNLPSYIEPKFYAYAIVFGFSLTLFGYGALYVRDSTFDDFTRWIFFVSMGLVLLILFSVPVLLLAGIQLLLGGYLLHMHYYSFEPTSR
jgi:hypothetical protein